MKWIRNCFAAVVLAGVLFGFSGMSAQAANPATVDILIPVEGIGFGDGYFPWTQMTAELKSGSIANTNWPEPTRKSVSTADHKGLRFSPALQISKAGTYRFEFRMTSTDPSYIGDTRSYQLDIIVSADSSGNLTAKTQWYLSGESVSSPRFIIIKPGPYDYSHSVKQKAQKMLDSMSLRQKVGQMFVTHFDGGVSFTDTQKELAKAQDLVETYHPGGVLLFKWNVQNDTPSTLKKRISDTQSVSDIPLSVQVDEEGGRVTRVSSVPAFRSSAFPAPQTVLAKGLSNVNADASEKAGFLLDLGFNMNLAPVADVANTGYIFDRTYGGDGVANAKAVRQAVLGHKSGSDDRMGTCLKHFPGYGSTSANTHNGFAVNNLTMNDFNYNDLLPFYEGMSAGSDMVLVTHNIINCYDRENPASLSPVIYRLLREHLQFEKVAITDDLGMKAITDHVGSSKSAAGEAIKAGADMVITAKITEEYPKVLAMAQSKELSMDRVDEAVLRVLCSKISRGVLTDKDISDFTDFEASYFDGSGELIDHGTLEHMWDLAKAGGGTIRLNKDLSKSGTFAMSGKKIVLELNGKELEYTGSGTLFEVSGKGDFAVKDSKGELVVTSHEAVDGNVCNSDADTGALYYHIDGWDESFRFERNQQTAGNLLGNDSNRLIHGADSTIRVERCGLRGAGNSAIYAEGSGKILVDRSYFMDNKKNGVIQVKGTACPVTVSGLTYFTHNENAGNGGVIYTEGDCVINSDSRVLRNSAKNGGAVYARNLTVNEASVFGWNTSSESGGAVMVTGNLIINSSKVSKTDIVRAVGNQSKGHGGGFHVSGTGNAVSGLFVTKENRSPDGYSGVYLTEGATFSASGLLSGSSILVRTESMEDEIPVIVSGDWGLTKDHLSVIVPGDVSYRPAFDNGGITLVKSKSVNVSYGVLMDGEYLSLGSFSSVHGADISPDGGRRYYVELNDALENLKEYGLTLDQLKSGCFGILGASTVETPEEVPKEAGGKYRMYLDESVWADGKLLYLPNGGTPGMKTVAQESHDNGFWSIDVRDVRDAVLHPGQTTQSYSTFVKSGGSKTLSLVNYGGFWNWRDVREDSSQYDAVFMVKDANTEAAIKNIYSPVVITNGTDKDKMYTVQCYAYVDTYDLSDAARDDRLPVIDTSGAVLPSNGKPKTVKYLTVDAAKDNQLLKNRNLTKMYEDSRFVYRVSPRLTYADRMKSNAGFDLSEIWVLREGRSASSKDPADFVIYKKAELPQLESLKDLKLTTNPDKVSDTTILIEEGTVIRFVYHPKEGTSEISSDFYDYDISDGKVYKNNYTSSDSLPTSQQDKFVPAYAFTQKQGINHPDNYHKDGGRLAFGNANTGTTMDTQKVNDETFINKANGKWTDPKYERACFGLVKGLLHDEEKGFYLDYADGVSAPYLFGYGDAIGKTPYKNVPLVFGRSGDNYVLDSVSGTNAKDLGVFFHPVCADTEYTTIWTNNFWPADDFDSFGGDGHDMKTGDYYKKSQRKFINPVWAGDYPPSDDGVDHNAYFGMTSNIEFTLPEGYLGPLEYVFFGDDDMWMFLDDKLVLDIGGVHPSIGEYVNLWDYLDESDMGKTHRLTLFYTERGASGSTCYMGFNIPGLESGTEPLDEGQVDLSKKVTGVFAPNDEEYSFTIRLRDADGNVPLDDYSIQRRAEDGTVLDYGVLEGGEGVFQIKDKEHLYIPELPAGYTYEITEYDGDYQTSFEDSDQKVDGNTVSGTIEGKKTWSLVCVNHYDMGVILPDTGSKSLWYLLLFGGAAVLCGSCALAVLRRRRKFG